MGEEKVISIHSIGWGNFLSNNSSRLQLKVKALHILALSDIHGNVKATRSLVEYISTQAYTIDLIIIAGDLVQCGGEQRDWDEFWLQNNNSDLK